MKKLLLMAAVAGMTLASCTSENDDYASKKQEISKISFASPVMSGMTRADYTPIAGEIAAPYPKSERFKVFGRRYLSSAQYPGWATAIVEYDDAGEETTHNPSLKGWDTVLSHFWVNGMKYTFGAVSPSTVNATYDASGVNIAGFTPAALGSQYDLMWAPRVYDVVQTSMSTQNDGSTAYNGVNLTFSHALASIQFNIGVHPDNVKVPDGHGSTTAIADGIFKIKSIELIKLDGTADFSEGISVDGPSKVTETPVWTNNTGEEASYKILDKTSSPINIPVKSEASSIATAMTAVNTLGGHDAILIPQKFTTNAAIVVVWTANGTDSESNIVWNTTTIKLKSDSSTEWKMGYRYKYNLAFQRNRIFFAPEVEAWKDGGAIDNVIDK